MRVETRGREDEMRMLSESGGGRRSRGGSQHEPAAVAAQKTGASTLRYSSMYMGKHCTVHVLHHRPLVQVLADLLGTCYCNYMPSFRRLVLHARKSDGRVELLHYCAMLLY